MRIRFYCDVPKTHYEGALYWAVTHVSVMPSPGYTRVAFDVELPLEDPRAAVLVPSSAASCDPERPA